MTETALSIELYRHELKDRPCRRVQKTDKEEVLRLIEEMARFCAAHGGAGLAAPQVGVFLQLAILMTGSNEVEALINPEIVNLAGRDMLETEGCLSLPMATAKIWRSEIAHVAGGSLDEPDLGRVTIYKGRTARVVQHEIDHLKGIFFLDHCQAVSRGIALRSYSKYLRLSARARGASVTSKDPNAADTCAARLTPLTPLF